MVGCGPHRHSDYYDFDFQKPLDYRQLVFKSSEVIVGTVRAVKISHSGVPARKAPELLLDETTVDVDVENVLRGEWSAPQLQFVFFGYSPKNRGGYNGPAPYHVEVGERRIFFLTKDSGQFRSVADVRGDYSIRVWSGAHRHFRRSEAPGEAWRYVFDPTPLGNDLSAILLELGEGFASDAMAATLGRAAYVSDELASRKATVSHLLKLAGDGRSQSLQIASCVMLAEQYAGQSSCLLNLEKDASLRLADRQRIDEALRKRKQWDVRLKEALRARPMGAFDLITVAAVRDELELLIADPDPELHQLACEALLHSFGIQYPRCSARK
jgi:hypothetical protein